MLVIVAQNGAGIRVAGSNRKRGSGQGVEKPAEFVVGFADVEMCTKNWARKPFNSLRIRVQRMLAVAAGLGWG